MGRPGRLTITNLFVRGSSLVRYMANMNVALVRAKCPLGEGLHFRVIP
jgi:hypothetical protein